MCEGNIALIAGEGSLPVSIANRLTERGMPPVVYSIREHVGELSKYALDVVMIKKLNISAAIDDMKNRSISRLYMAGQISKTVAFRPSLLDFAMQKILASVAFRDDHSLLGAIVDYFEKNGIRVESYKEIVKDMLASSGHIAGRKASPNELADADYGVQICRILVPLSFGQTVIINQRTVVAVEAMEGTDATILRAGSLCKGGTMVKMMRLDQDERYDIPTVGTDTLKYMSQSRLTCLALHVGRTLIMEPEKFAMMAGDNGISVIGVDFCQSS